MTDDWSRVAALAQSGKTAEALGELTDFLIAAGRWHELFDVRLVEARARLGAPLTTRGGWDDLDEPLRTHLEESYVAACREVGGRFLAAGQWREAWLYLRPAGGRAEVVAALEAATPAPEQLDAAVELAVYQGLAPRRGLRWVLDRYGTCTAISTIEGAWQAWTAEQRAEVAAELVDHLHGELVANVIRDITGRGGAPPASASLVELVAGRDELFAENNYHVDSSHLHATVRLAREVRDPQTLERAWELTEYGRRLAPLYHYPGEPPFEDSYRGHGLFFAAQLGRQVDEAVAYFDERAHRLPAAEQGSGPAETLVVLWTRLGRTDEAIAQTVELLPPGTALSGWAPSLVELCQTAGQFRRLVELALARGESLGLAVGLWAQEKTQAVPKDRLGSTSELSARAGRT